MIGLIGCFFPLLSFPLIDKISAFYFELLLIHFRKVWDIKLLVWNIEKHIMKVLYINTLNISYISKYMKLICDLKKYTLSHYTFGFFK